MKIYTVLLFFVVCALNAKPCGTTRESVTIVDSGVLECAVRTAGEEGVVEWYYAIKSPESRNMGSASLLVDTRTNKALLELLYVNEAMRGKGIGSFLLSRVLQDARLEELLRISLHATLLGEKPSGDPRYEDAFNRLVGFYERHGAERIEMNYTHEGWPLYAWMRIDLN